MPHLNMCAYLLSRIRSQLMGKRRQRCKIVYLWYLKLICIHLHRSITVNNDSLLRELSDQGSLFRSLISTHGKAPPPRCDKKKLHLLNTVERGALRLFAGARCHKHIHITQAPHAALNKLHAPRF
jgi:hypothetical protein